MVIYNKKSQHNTHLHHLALYGLINNIVDGVEIVVEEYNTELGDVKDLVNQVKGMWSETHDLILDGC